MHYKLLNDKELVETKVGAAVTVTTVMTIALVALMAVVFYQLLVSKKGSVTVPGGWKFTWN